MSLVDDELRRHDTLEKAVRAADAIILGGYYGSKAELMLLTILMANKFVEKAGIMAQSEILQIEIDRLKEGG